MLEFKDIDDNNYEEIDKHLKRENYIIPHFCKIIDDYKVMFDGPHFIGIISLMYGKQIGMVNDLFIRKEFRNSIYFKYIVRYAFEEFKKKGLEIFIFQVNIDDIRSINFHTKRGAKYLGYKINFISYTKTYHDRVK